MANISMIREVGVPVICLSGSLTPTAVPALIDFFGFPSSLLCVVRADTPRPFISYHAIQVTENELFTAVVKEIEGFYWSQRNVDLCFATLIETVKS
jgi:hypothetical protein